MVPITPHLSAPTRKADSTCCITARTADLFSSALWAFSGYATQLILFFSCCDYLVIAAPDECNTVDIRPEHALLHVHHRVSVNAA
jgi:hypothetical protein